MLLVPGVPCTAVDTAFFPRGNLMNDDNENSYRPLCWCIIYNGLF